MRNKNARGYEDNPTDRCKAAPTQAREQSRDVGHETETRGCTGAQEPSPPDQTPPSGNNPVDVDEAVFRAVRDYLLDTVDDVAYVSAGELERKLDTEYSRTQLGLALAALSHEDGDLDVECWSAKQTNRRKWMVRRDDPVAMTDGGCKYVNPTGPGYLSRYSTRSDRIHISATAVDGMGWGLGQRLFGYDIDVGYAVEATRHDEAIDEHVVSGSRTSDRAVNLSGKHLEYIGVEPGDDVRAYKRGDRMVMVPADPDPMLEAELVTDGGVDTTERSGTELNRFQLEVLYVLADGEDYGLGIKRSLEEFYGDPVNHGRLYPNLDTLHECGYIDVGSVDRRTNSYRLTDDGWRVVANDAYRRACALGADLEPEDILPAQRVEDNDRELVTDGGVDVVAFSDTAVTGYEWPVSWDGDDYFPIPASWIEHPAAYDRDLRVGPSLLAVSAAKVSARTLRVRYAHPTGRDVLVCQTGAEPHGEGVVPAALSNRSGWARSLKPGPSEPKDTLRRCEVEHMVDIWSDVAERVPREWDDVETVTAGGDC